jgi:hypothetical protein
MDICAKIRLILMASSVQLLLSANGSKTVVRIEGKQSLIVNKNPQLHKCVCTYLMAPPATLRNALS